MDGYKTVGTEKNGWNSGLGLFSKGLGAKAGSFVSQKHFHPSNIKNIKQVWAGKEEQRLAEQKEADAMKRRQEENALEELRKEMAMRGQRVEDTRKVKGDGMFSRMNGGPNKSHLPKDQQKAMNETQRRVKHLLAQEKRDAKALAVLSVETSALDAEMDEDPVKRALGSAAASSSADGGPAAGADGAGAGPNGPKSPAKAQKRRKAVQSIYKEDVFVNGHTSVWGSWREADSEKWGYLCCRITDKTARCPLESERTAKERAAKRQKTGR